MTSQGAYQHSSQSTFSNLNEVGSYLDYRIGSESFLAFLGWDPVLFPTAVPRAPRAWHLRGF